MAVKTGYYHDMSNKEITLVNTVQENKEGFSSRQLEQAKKTRKLYHVMGLSLIHDFKNLVKNNMIYNFPVTVTDVSNSMKIYGSSIASLK